METNNNKLKSPKAARKSDVRPKVSTDKGTISTAGLLFKQKMAEQIAADAIASVREQATREDQHRVGRKKRHRKEKLFDETDSEEEMSSQSTASSKKHGKNGHQSTFATTSSPQSSVTTETIDEQTHYGSTTPRGNPPPSPRPSTSRNGGNSHSSLAKGLAIQSNRHGSKFRQLLSSVEQRPALVSTVFPNVIMAAMKGKH